MGCEELVGAVKELDGFSTTRAYEEESGIHDTIDQYNEDCFWDELINRLADRDTREEAVTSGKDISSAEDYWKMSIPYESKYAEEFSKNGLKNLKISETWPEV